MCISDADAAAFGGDERWAQGAVVPPDPRSLVQAPPRISSFCVCARVPFVYKPYVYIYIYIWTHRYIPEESAPRSHRRFIIQRGHEHTRTGN